MADDYGIGGLVGAGITLMVADRILRPRSRTRVVYRRAKKKRR